MSSHYKFEVHIKTPGENDDEEARVERFAEAVRKLAACWIDMRNDVGLEITVRDVERN